MTIELTNYYRVAQIREMERMAIEQYQIPGAVLMERAGEAAWKYMQSHFKSARRMLVICGTGNNGGDAYVLARLASQTHKDRQDGLDVVVYQAGKVERLRGDALRMAERLRDETDVSVLTGDCPDLSDYDAIVDGLLGTGLQGEVSDYYRGIIEAVNAANKPVLSLDIPSGLNADTGAVMGVAIKASLTPTFIGFKQGMATADGPEYCRQTPLDHLGIPLDIFQAMAPSALQMDIGDAQALIPERSCSAHKGDFGHLLLIGGEHGYTGAAILAGEAALRTGAGLVSLATRAEHAVTITTARPELMCHGVEQADQLAPLLEKATAVAIGPGLGQSDWARSLLERVIESGLPMVVDADALNLLALLSYTRHPQHPQHKANWILTPHPGEAGRLLGVSSQQIQQNRFQAATEIQTKYGGVVVLKGAGTLVQVPDETVNICVHGNPGMASGGMGDVLTGIIGALLAQGLPLADAARYGVCVHSNAADFAGAEHGHIGLMASDLLGLIKEMADR